MADTTEKTIAEELREAAARAREGLVLAAEAHSIPGSPIVAVCGNHVGISAICDNCVHFDARDMVLARLIVVLINAREPLASWLYLAAGRYDEDVYEDEIGCNPGGTHGDFCEADCPGHKPVAICDRCGNRVGPDAPEGSRCGCWDKALAVARVLNGTKPQEVPDRG